MKFIRYPAGIYQANCYIVYDEITKDGFIIDPGGDADDILDLLNVNDIKANFILLTHGHFDHTGGVNAIKEKLHIPVYINENDNNLVSTDDEKSPSIIPISDAIKIDSLIKHGDNIKFGQSELFVIETPGHTPGGVSIRIKDTIFTGDTLFAGSVGRSDLPGGSHDILIESIKERLFVLPDDTKVYPGHGPSSTIGKEKKYNPFFK